MSAREEPDSVTRDAECEACGGDGRLINRGDLVNFVGGRSGTIGQLPEGWPLRCDNCGLYYKVAPDGLIPSGPWAPEKGE